MAITYLPKVRLELTESGRGRVFVNDVEMPWVNKVSVEIEGGRFTRVTMQTMAEIEMTAEHAEVFINTIPPDQPNPA